MSARLPRVDVTFAPAWWHTLYGMDFTERVLCNPVARTEQEREQRRVLFERFGDVGLGEKDPRPNPCADGAYGHRFMAALWGCDIKYMPDHDPSAIALSDGFDRVLKAEVCAFHESPIVRQCFEDARVLRRHYGKCSGGINLGGPLNNAVSVLGEDVLMACAAEPDRARFILRKMAEACLWVYDNVTCRIDEIVFAEKRPFLGMGNCPVCMISPETYRRVVLPADLWYREHFHQFLLHHCGIFHPYCEAYRALRPEHLHVGWGSDLRVVRQAFPQARMLVQVQAKDVTGKSAGYLDNLFTRLAAEAGPMELISNIWIADVGPEVSDQNIRDMVTCLCRTRGTNA